MAAKRRTSQDMPPMSLRASVVPSSLNEEKRTVDLVWSTGAAVLRRRWDGDFYEELSLEAGHVRMGRLESGAPLLNSHNSWDLGGVLGVTESADVKSGEGTATVRFARAEDDEDADRVFRKVKDGVIRNVSVGYRVYRYEKTEEEGKLPVFRATDWEPYELSLVPMGADAGAAVRAEGADTNPCEFIELAQEMEMPKKTEETRSAPVQKSAPTPAAIAEPAKPAAPIDEVAVRAQERERIESIQRTAGSLDLPADFAARHIAANTSIDAFRAAAFDEFEKAKKPIVTDAGRVAVVPGEDARDKWLRGASDWLIQRSAVAGVVEDAAKKRGETYRVDPGEFRGLSLLDLARQALERAGVKTRGMDKMTLVGRALTHRAAGYQTTGDFPILLENTMHKVLLAAYGVTPDTWSRFCAVGSVSDFRAHNRYRLGTFGSLDTVAEHGEFTNKALPDARKESITAATKGNIVGLSRQALINDDMGAFTRIATMLGRAARLSVEMDVYTLLALNAGLGPAMTDGDTLFHANHSNVGAGAALSSAAIDAERVILGQQTDESGNEILDLRPSVLVLPIGLGSLARVINEAQYDPDADGKLAPNTTNGLFGDIVDTGRMSGTRRYLFADPAIAPVLEVAFLDGQQAPYLEVKDGFRVDGVEWKVRLDYGVGAIDFRGAITDAGA